MLRESLSPVLEYHTGSGKSGSTGGNGTGTIARVHNPNPDDRLNLRTKPSTDAPSLGKYYNGVDVTLLGPEENGWYKVKFGTLTGYMQAEFLETDPDKMWMVQSVSISFRVNNASGTGLNLRELQSTKSKSLGFYKNGEIGYVFGVGETWCHVLMSDETFGFMLRENLSPVPVFDKGNAPVASGDTPGKGWAGPVGAHLIADWPLGITGYDTAVVNNPNPSDRLHLRSEPKEGAKSLGRYYNGVRVTINIPSDMEWTRVNIGNYHGYMRTEFLAFGDPAQSIVASAMPIMVVNNPGSAANLNLREGPFAAAKSLGVYPNGTKVILMGFNDTWAHVIVDGQMGFMQASYLK